MKENKCLNFMKGISCIIVVLLHCRLPGVIGDSIIYALRFPVPVFFMISGYFCYYRKPEWIKRALLKVLRLLLCSEAACGVVCLLLEGGDQIRNMALWSHPLRTLLCGTLFNGTLWYLYAMLWTWLFLYLVKRGGKSAVRRIYWLIPALLFIHIAGRLYLQKTGDIGEWIYLFRSSLLYGIPFVLLGHFFAENKSRIHKNISDIRCALLFISGIFAMVAEFLVWHCYMDMWLSTVLIASAMFLYAVNHSEKEVIPVIAKIGKRDSMIIYVSHIPFSLILDGCLKPCMNEAVYGWARPFLTIAAALTMAEVFHCIHGRFLSQRQP